MDEVTRQTVLESLYAEHERLVRRIADIAAAELRVELDRWPSEAPEWVPDA